MIALIRYPPRVSHALSVCSAGSRIEISRHTTYSASPMAMTHSATTPNEVSAISVTAPSWLASPGPPLARSFCNPSIAIGTASTPSTPYTTPLATHPTRATVTSPGWRWATSSTLRETL
jgi:hypothetical protein